MDFLLGLLTGIALGFLWGVWRATQSFIQRIIERPEEIKEIMTRVEKITKEVEKEQSDAQPIQTSGNEVRVEFHQGVCYLYDHNDKFLAQGATAVDAIRTAEQRFPGMTFNLRLNDSNKSSQ